MAATTVQRVTILSNPIAPGTNPNVTYYYVVAQNATGSAGGFTMNVNLSYLPPGVLISDIAAGQSWIIENSVSGTWTLKLYVGEWFNDSGWIANGTYFYRLIGSQVSLRGTSATIPDLPAGFTPIADIPALAVGNTASGTSYVSISTTGAITVSTGIAYLDNISFFVD